MAEPTYLIATERLYASLPEYMRQADAKQNYILKRWVSCIADQQSLVDLLISRIDYVPTTEGGIAGDTSDLVDPVTANVEWLTWLGQLVGVSITPNLSDQEKRDAVRYASSGWRVGTKKALADAAKSELTGTKYAQVYDHSTDSSVIGAASEWDVLIVTRGTETPNVAAVLEAVKRKRAKPAGVLLWHRAYTAPWSASFRDTAVSTPGKYPTWGALAADNGTWVKIEEAGL